MSKSKPQDKGNFRAFKNKTKEIGDDRPLFQGKLSLANSKDERTFALWPYASTKDGSTILSGRAGASASEQIAVHTQPSDEHVQRLAVELPARDGAEPFKLEPNALVLFTNKTQNERDTGRPDYYGFYNPGDGKAQRVAAWSQLDRYGNAMLSGSLQDYDQANDRDQEPADKKRTRDMEMAR